MMIHYRAAWYGNAQNNNYCLQINTGNTKLESP